MFVGVGAVWEQNTLIGYQWGRIGITEMAILIIPHTHLTASNRAEFGHFSFFDKVYGFGEKTALSGCIQARVRKAPYLSQARCSNY